MKRNSDVPGPAKHDKTPEVSGNDANDLGSNSVSRTGASGTAQGQSNTVTQSVTSTSHTSGAGHVKPPRTGGVGKGSRLNNPVTGQQEPQQPSPVSAGLEGDGRAGDEVEDVVRSGIVSRILSSVSGRPLESPYSPAGSENKQKTNTKSSSLVPSARAASSTTTQMSKISEINKDDANGNKTSGRTGPIGPRSNANPAVTPASNNTATNHNLLPASKSETRASPASSDRDTLSQVRSEPKHLLPSGPQAGAAKGVSFVNIGGGERRSATTHGSNLENPSLDSGKSRETKSQTGQIYPPDTKSYVPVSSGGRETIAADIPQSLSADSGIGSPTDANIIGIDPGGGGGHDGNTTAKDKKWKGEIKPSGGSSAPQIVSPPLMDTAQNYRPCKNPGDAPSYSASSDTSNYPPAPTAPEGQSIHGDLPLKQDSHSGTFSTRNESGKLNLGAPASNQAEEAGPEAVCTPSDNATNYDSNQLGLGKGELPSGTTTHTGTVSATKDNNSAETSGPESSPLAEGDQKPSVLHTLHPSEFTVESVTGDTESDPRKTTENSESQIPAVKSLSDIEISVEKSSVENDNREVKVHCNDDKQRSQDHSTVIDVKEDANESPAPESQAVRTSEAPQFNADKTAPEKPQRFKTLRDVNLQEVIALSDSPNTDRKIKGILKIKSEPTLRITLDRSVTSSPVDGVKNGVPKQDLSASRSVSFKKTHTKNTFSYYNAAFEGEIITEPSKRPSLADVVSHIMRQNSIIEIDDDNSHPYGRDSSLTDLMTGKRSDNYKVDAGKMIVWLALAIMIVSLAGGIIFMSETYNLSHRNNGLVISTQDTTTLGRSS